MPSLSPADASTATINTPITTNTSILDVCMSISFTVAPRSAGSYFQDRSLNRVWRCANSLGNVTIYHDLVRALVFGAARFGPFREFLLPAG